MRLSASRITLISLGCLLPPTISLAGGGECGSSTSVVQHIFEMADQDRSGALTPSEYAAGRLERYGVSFEQADTDSDGETSLAEYIALYERHHPTVDEDAV